MQIHRLASRLLPAVLCALVAACANEGPPRPSEPPIQAPPPPDYTAPQSDTVPVPAPASNPRLTIQSGEGERLNLPWFIRDAQNWINR
ncbi:hypothetical protein GG851_15980 [Bordetella petrii]|nr:hypothetical protein [Bordetella petrii]